MWIGTTTSTRVPTVARTRGMAVAGITTIEGKRRGRPPHSYRDTQIEQISNRGR
eukprot:SAG11_NODE_1041_length_6056_cov_5.902468_8_plen_54_part_00